MKSTFRRWLPLAFVALILAGLSYAGQQQILRQDANDPQIQLAEDVATAMNAGATATDIVPQTSVDVSKSLSPFVLIYDKDNKLTGTDVVIGTTKPEIPAGVLNVARDRGINRVTWEPQAGVRAAIVAMKDKNGNIVVVGRSLREIEIRERQQMVMAGGALVVALLGSFLIMWILDGGMKMKPRAPKVETVAVTPTPEHHDMPAHSGEHHDHDHLAKS